MIHVLKPPFWDYFKSLYSHPEYFDNEAYSFYASMAFCFALIVLLSLCAAYDAIRIDYINSKAERDRVMGTKKSLSGYLIDKMYTNDGFLFFVKSDKIYKVEVNMQQFYSWTVGDKVEIEVTIGGDSKKELETKFIS